MERELELLFSKVWRHRLEEYEDYFSLLKKHGIKPSHAIAATHNTVEDFKKDGGFTQLRLDYVMRATRCLRKQLSEKMEDARRYQYVLEHPLCFDESYMDFLKRGKYSTFERANIDVFMKAG